MNILKRPSGPAAIMAVSLMVYVLSAQRTFSQGGPPLLPPVPMNAQNIWLLEISPWKSLFDDPARTYTNLNAMPSFDYEGTALSVDSANSPAFLQYDVFQDGWTNVSLDNGSLSIWCQANWTSVADGGAGPGAWAAVWDLGSYSRAATNGAWLLAMDPPGRNLVWLAQAGGSNQFLAAGIDFDAGDFHQIFTTWSSSNASLYVDGQLAASNSGPITCVPSYADCVSNGWTIGALSASGANAGTNQFHGQLQWLVSYAYPLSAEEVAADFASMSAYIASFGYNVPGGGGGFLGGGGGFGPADDAPAPPGGGGGSTNGGGPFDYGYTNGFTPPAPISATDYAAYSQLYLTITNSGGNAAIAVQNSLSNLTYLVLTNTDLSNSNGWGLWETILATNSIAFAPPLAIGTNPAMFFQVALDWCTTGSGLPDWWSMYYFNSLVNADADFDGTGFSVLYDYQNGVDPNVIAFNLTATNQFLNAGSLPMQTTVTAGIPFYMASLVDDTNWADASWTPYASNMTVSIGTNQGWHQIWVGLRGLPATGQQTWAWYRVKLDTMPPLLVITNPSSSTIMQPMIEVQGYCPESLSSLTYDLSNASGFFSNQSAVVLHQYYTSNTYEFTTNTFQAFDVPVTNGANTFTFHAADLAGNVTTTNFTYTLSYAGRTNPPVVHLYWPSNGTCITGSNFTERGSLDDFTTSLQATIVNTNGNTNTISAIVERNGNFWIENLPLAAGSNQLTLTATDVAGNVTTTNITVVGSSLTLTMDAIESDLLWQMTEEVTGTISDPTLSIWINGVEGTNNGDGTWDATVPSTPGGTSVFQVRAIASSDNGGSGSGPVEGTPTYASLNNPTSATATDVEVIQDRPTRLYGSQYNVGSTNSVSLYGETGLAVGWTNYDVANWSDGIGGSAVSTFIYRAQIPSNFFTDIITETIPPGYWGEFVFTPIVLVDSNDGTNTNIVHGFDGWAPEHCNVNLPTNSDGGAQVQTFLRTAQLSMQFDSGGKGVPGAENVYLIYFPYPGIVDALSANPILPQTVSVGSYGHLDNNGYVALALSAGATAAVTPLVAGLTAYIFNEAYSNVNLISLSVVSNSAAQVGGLDNWAAVKTATNDWVYIQANLSNGDPSAAAQIQWSGAEVVPGNPSQARVSKTTSAMTTVTAILGSTALSINVWVLWVTIQIDLSQNATNPAPVKFGNAEDKTELLGVQYFTNSNAVCGKMCGIATITPAGIHSIITSGWGYSQMKMGNVFSDGRLLNVSDPTWTNDEYDTNYQSLVPDGGDRIYALDGPALSDSIATNSAGYYKNFYDFVTWNSQLCSDTNYFWHFEATWTNNQTPPFNPVDLNTGQITIP